MLSRIREDILESSHTLSRLQGSAFLIDAIDRSAKLCSIALMEGHKILLCGNGGSAGQAQHIAAELTGRFMGERRALAAIALTADSTAVTAIGNDYGYEKVFSRQVEALGRQGDVLIGISTSGNSVNVMNAMDTGKKQLMHTIALCGEPRGRIILHADFVLDAPSTSTPRIQEAHLLIGHALCRQIEYYLFEREDAAEEK